LKLQLKIREFLKRKRELQSRQTQQTFFTEEREPETVVRSETILEEARLKDRIALNPKIGGRQEEEKGVGKLDPDLLLDPSLVGIRVQIDPEWAAKF